jgi:hypothetical protein
MLELLQFVSGVYLGLGLGFALLCITATPAVACQSIGFMGLVRGLFAIMLLWPFMIHATLKGRG